MKISLYLVAGLTGIFTVVDLAPAQTWTPTTAPPQDWQAIASSADSLKLAAAGFQTEKSQMDLIPGPGPLYTSTDSGATWNQTTAPFGDRCSLACSADGSKLVAADGGNDGTQNFFAHGFVHPHGHGSIYTSTNAGATWTQAGAPSNAWSSVASSADGTKLAAAAYLWDYPVGDGLIYTSTNSGVTWMPTSAPGNTWSGVVSSADGTRLVAASEGTYDTNGVFVGNAIYASSDSGVTWALTSAPRNNWSSVALTADGAKVVAAAQGIYDTNGVFTGNAIYVSENSGSIWTQTSAPSNNWTSVAASSDGIKLVAAATESTNTSVYDATYGLIYSSTNSGRTWMQASAPSNWWPSVACSADGAKIVGAGDRLYTASYSGPWKLADAPADPWVSVASSADGTSLTAVAALYSPTSPGLIYESGDSGATWSQTSAPTNDWSSVAASTDGTRLVATSDWDSGFGDGLIYTSTNSGSTWTQGSAPINHFLLAVASSADGTKLIAASLAGPVFTSADSGTTWRQAQNAGDYPTSVASSADGTHLVVASEEGIIYASPDSGVTWAVTSAPQQSPWLSVACSSDGTKLVACTEADYNSPDSLIYTSADTGATWTQTSAPSNYWSSVTCSADGSTMAACAGVSKPPDFGWSGASGFETIYLSTNSGATWEDTRAPGESWTSVVISANGKSLVAVSQEDSCIYTLQLPLSPPTQSPSPRLAATPSASGLGISWLVPSTSFLLQQNSDLTTTNWTDVSMTPSLNYANLHYEVMVSPTNGQRFYRLRQQ